MHNVFAKIPVQYCNRCGRIFLNVKYCLWCGKQKNNEPMPPRHQYRELESIPSARRGYYEADLPIDLYKGWF